MATSIQVDDATWRELNRMKERGQSFDDVVRELIAEANGAIETDHGGNQ